MTADKTILRNFDSQRNGLQRQKRFDIGTEGPVGWAYRGEGVAIEDQGGYNSSEKEGCCRYG
jgi:hypothetical protein